MFLISKWKARRKHKQADTQKKQAAERTETLSRFDKALEDAEQIKNPIEKITALKKIEQDIENEVSRTNTQISKEAHNGSAYFKAVFSSLAVGAAIVGACILMAPVIGPVAGVVGVISIVGALGYAALFAPNVDNKAIASTTKRLTQDAQGFYSKLDEKKKAAAALADQMVEDNAQAIARQPEQEREKLLALPGIKDKFTSVVANKYVAVADELAANDDEPAADAVTAKPAAANSKPSL